MARRKGSTENRKVRRGPNKGSTATLITIRGKDGNIKNSYRPYSPSAYRASKRRKRKRK